MNTQMLEIKNGQPVRITECPEVSFDAFRDDIRSYLQTEQAHVSALFAVPLQSKKARLYCVLSNRVRGVAAIISTMVENEYPTLTPAIPQLHWFERELYEIHKIKPLGHPWLKPIRSLFPPPDKTGMSGFYRLEGEEVHEVAVGPVHAGVIEPGHFRFQCHGEIVYHLEISLGYQHRGVEKAVAKGPDKKTIHYIETLAGDTTIGHTTTYCRLLEGLAGTPVSLQVETIRSVAAELERLANHIGDTGALAGDVGYLPTKNYCGRIRGDILNVTGELCGNRFGRGLVIPGGLSKLPDQKTISRMVNKLAAAQKDYEDAAGLMFSSPSVLARLEGTGIVTQSIADEIGLVGPAARASGLVRDVRSQLPYGRYLSQKIPTSTYHTGDCYARAYVRLLETRASFAFINKQLTTLPMDSYTIQSLTLRPEQLIVALTEGWRGEICHIAATNATGNGFAFYKIIDPSFHNWFGLSCALRNQQISDFPLCNKSFNLSYCGHDL